MAASCARFVGELDYADAADRLVGLRCVEPGDLTEAHLHYLQAEVALFRGQLDMAGEFHSTFSDSAGSVGPAFADPARRPDGLLKLAYEGDLDSAVTEAADLAARAAAFGPRDTVAAWATYAHGEVLIDLDPQRAQASARPRSRSISPHR